MGSAGAAGWEEEFGDVGGAGVPAAGAGAAGGASGAAGAGARSEGPAGIAESSSNPVLVKQNTRTHLVWRVRNIPYPLETYDITVDAVEQQIVVRTSNKKYFKRLEVPALYRAAIPLSSESLQVSHSNNTLLIKYAKPAALLELEEKEREQVEEAARTAQEKGGDVGCAQQ